MEDNEQCFAELKERLATALDLCKTYEDLCYQAQRALNETSPSYYEDYEPMEISL